MMLPSAIEYTDAVVCMTYLIKKRDIIMHFFT
jgi:hypothetical protein